MERMIAEQQRTTDAILTLAEAIKQQPQRIEIREVEREKVSTGHSVDTSGQLETIYTRERIVEAGKTYTRDTHSLLFMVVDWLEDHAAERSLSVRKLAEAFQEGTGTSVSKSWAAVAKNYWAAQSN